MLEVGPEKAVADGDLSIERYATVKKSIDLYRLCTLKHPDLEKLENFWIYGATGVGKSRAVR